MRPPKEGIKIKINEGEQYDISLVAQVEHYQAYLPTVAKGQKNEGEQYNISYVAQIEHYQAYFPPLAGPPVPRRATARAAAS